MVNSDRKKRVNDDRGHLKRREMVWWEMWAKTSSGGCVGVSQGVKNDDTGPQVA